jgi:hypothetical protein
MSWQPIDELQECGRVQLSPAVTIAYSIRAVQQRLRTSNYSGQ